MGSNESQDATTPVHTRASPDANRRQMLTPHQESSSWHSKGARYLYMSTIFVLLTGLLLNQVGVFTWVFENHISNSKSQSEAQKDRGIGLVLHPQDHVNRPPRTLTFDWKITKGFRSPDGVLKEVYLVNDQFPGETIEARSGDRVIVNVTNLLSDEGLAIHWHGLRMKGANDMDGAVGLTQNPTSTGHHFLYNFTIGDDEFGAFWYHGHEKTQRDDGLYGGFVVHRPSEQLDEKAIYGYDDEILLLVGDWYHRSSSQVLAWYMNSRSFGNEPVPDSLLVNGKGNFDCGMAVPARPVQCTPAGDRDELPSLWFDCGKRYRLRLVNTGSLTGFSLRLDAASFSPFQVDGGNEIKIAQTSGIGIVYPGERVDAILQISPSSKQRHLQIQMDDENFKYPNPALEPSQMFPVTTFPTPDVDSDSAPPELEYYNLQAAVPISSYEKMDVSAPLKFVLYTSTLKLARHHNIPMGFINHTSFSPQTEPLISLSRTQYDKNQFVPHIPLYHQDASKGDESSGWVEIVINNLDDGGHPFHLHGYSFYVVSVFPPPTPWSSEKPRFTPGGSAMYNYNPFAAPPAESPAGVYNLINPIKKDTVFIPQRGYVVIRFRPDNEGIWMMHCHVGWHLGSGMAMSWDVS